MGNEIIELNRKAKNIKTIYTQKTKVSQKINQHTCLLAFVSIKKVNFSYFTNAEKLFSFIYEIILLLLTKTTNKQKK